MSRPRVIRKVVGWSNRKMPGGKRIPKKARDLTLQIDMERVRARDDRLCRYWDCPAVGQRIKAGTDYAKVINHNDKQGLFIKGRHIPQPKDFHFDCVPPETRPLVRFIRF